MKLPKINKSLFKKITRVHILFVTLIVVLGVFVVLFNTTQRVSLLGYSQELISTYYYPSAAPQIPVTVQPTASPELATITAQSTGSAVVTSPSPKASTLLNMSPSPKPSIAPSTVPTTPTSTTLPSSGSYTKMSVSAGGTTYSVDVIGADLNSTKVIIDTASSSNCSNDCPVLPVASYATRSNAYAAINGSFFCPAEYPSCAGKTNSFDTLLMNKDKFYFNSDNNVYSTVPAAIFRPGNARFVGQSLEWGRDTGVDAVIANYPLLVHGGQIRYTGAANEPKFGQAGPRAFIANKGSMVYIGYVRAATMEQSAVVLQAMGMENALNLDEGGSSALWYGGRYIVGPGRNVPNAVLFVSR